MFWVSRDTGRINVEIGLKVAAPALPTFWNVRLPKILIRKFDVVYFQNFPDLVHEISNWKHQFPSYIRTLFYLFYIFI